jgi:hypothetical protein
MAYTRNLLIIMKNNSILTEHILGLLVDRMLQIDIAIPLEAAQLNEFEPEQEREGTMNSGCLVLFLDVFFLVDLFCDCYSRC